MQLDCLDTPASEFFKLLKILIIKKGQLIIADPSHSPVQQVQDTPFRVQLIHAKTQVETPINSLVLADNAFQFHCHNHYHNRFYSVFDRFIYFS